MAARSGYYIELDDEAKKIAKDELHEDPKQTESQISTLRSWVQQQKHMNTRQDDDFLLMFLRQAKFSQIRAREVIEKYTKNRVTDPYKEIYVNKPKIEKDVSDIILSGCAFVLPGLPSSGYRTFVYRGGDLDTSKYNFRTSMKACMVCIDIALLDPSVQVFGHQWLADFDRATTSLITAMTPTNMRICAAGFMDATPMRLKGVHFFNCPYVLGAIITLLRSFLSKKIADRIHNHWSDIHLIQKKIEKEVLPEEYGGTAGTVKQLAAQFHDYAYRNAERLALFDQLSYQEGHEPDQQVQASFRKLNVD